MTAVIQAMILVMRDETQLTGDGELALPGVLDSCALSSCSAAFAVGVVSGDVIAKVDSEQGLAGNDEICWRIR